jgi:hypothetical protein
MVVDAAETVFAASGFDVWEHNGKVEGQASALRELARLAGLPQNLEELHEAAFVDRHGTMYLPLELAERLAHDYATAEPEIVLMYMEDQESEYTARGYEPASATTTTSCARTCPASRLPATGLDTRRKSRSFVARSSGLTTW